MHLNKTFGKHTYHNHTNQAQAMLTKGYLIPNPNSKKPNLSEMKPKIPATGLPRRFSSDCPVQKQTLHNSYGHATLARPCFGPCTPAPFRDTFRSTRNDVAVDPTATTTICPFAFASRQLYSCVCVCKSVPVAINNPANRQPA